MAIARKRERSFSGAKPVCFLVTMPVKTEKSESAGGSSSRRSNTRLETQKVGRSRGQSPNQFQADKPAMRRDVASLWSAGACCGFDLSRSGLNSIHLDLFGLLRGKATGVSLILRHLDS